MEWSFGGYSEGSAKAREDWHDTAAGAPEAAGAPPGLFMKGVGAKHVSSFCEKLGHTDGGNSCTLLAPSKPSDPGRPDAKLTDKEREALRKASGNLKVRVQYQSAWWPFVCDPTYEFPGKQVKSHRTNLSTAPSRTVGTTGGRRRPKQAGRQLHSATP